MTTVYETAANNEATITQTRLILHQWLQAMAKSKASMYPSGHNEMRTNALGPFQPQPRVQLEDLLVTKAAGHRGLGLMEMRSPRVLDLV